MNQADRQDSKRNKRGLRLTDTFKGCMYHIGSTKLIDGGGNAPHLEADDDVITIASIKADWPGLAGTNTEFCQVALCRCGVYPHPIDPTESHFVLNWSALPTF